MPFDPDGTATLTIGLRNTPETLTFLVGQTGRACLEPHDPDGFSCGYRLTRRRARDGRQRLRRKPAGNCRWRAGAE